MARRKNTRFIDPRYFMDEKMEVIKEQDLVEDASREKMDALMNAGIDPGDINDCRQSEYGFVKCLVMKNTGYANPLRDLGYIPAQPGSRDLKENVETFFRKVLGGNFNSVAGRAGGGSVTWNFDHERSSPGSTTMRGVAATQALGRKVAQGAEAGMQKLQQAIEKFNQDNGTNLKAETTMGKHDPDFERTGVRGDEQEVFVTISSEG